MPQRPSQSDRQRESQETMIRQWEMLLMIPQQPARLSTAQIAEHLGEKGHAPSVRTVQRDLEKLSALFAYTCETEGRTNYWFFPRRNKVIELPSMQPAAALALLMARDHSGRMLPPAMLELLEPYFDRADTVLTEADAAAANWRKRVLVVSRGPELLSPKISETVQRAAYQSLLEGKQLQASYRRRGAVKSKPMTLHPQGLVLREGVLYVVAMARDYTDLYHYALHRFTSAEMLSASARRQQDFDLATYVEQAFHYPLSPKSIRLRLRMDKGAAHHLEERPLAADQQIRLDDDDAVITATVADTEELRWWILGFGEKAEVLAPVGLRREIVASLQGMAARYSV